MKFRSMAWTAAGATVGAIVGLPASFLAAIGIDDRTAWPWSWNAAFSLMFGAFVLLFAAGSGVTAYLTRPPR